jgi:hypothetical protein
MDPRILKMDMGMMVKIMTIKQKEGCDDKNKD